MSVVRSVLSDQPLLFVASGARTTGLSVVLIVGVTVGGAAFIAVVIIIVVWLVRRRGDRPKPSQLDHYSLLNYNSLVSVRGTNLIKQRTV